VTSVEPLPDVAMSLGVLRAFTLLSVGLTMKLSPP
jgi:hypothetical protein